jgi:uncharacterized protein (TIGR03000 family)
MFRCSVSTVWGAAWAAALLALSTAPAAGRPDDPYRPPSGPDDGAKLENRPRLHWRLYPGAPDRPDESLSVLDYPADYPADAQLPSPRLPMTAGPARVGVFVPADAQVWFDGHETSQPRRWREFISPPLLSGSDYHYEVRASWKGEDGRVVDEKRSVAVHANGWVSVDFTRPERAARR